jgi:hypothetical protein
MNWLKIAWGLLTGNAGTILNATLRFFGKLSDNATAQLGTAVGAQRDVILAQLQTGVAAYQARASLIYGLWWCQVLLFAAYAPPVWHLGLVMLDSCPLLPGLYDGWLPWIVPHQVGSWSVAKLPGAYGEHEWEIVKSLLGIQLATVAGGSFLHWLHK